jgi:hypothetical protein
MMQRLVDPRRRRFTRPPMADVSAERRPSSSSPFASGFHRLAFFFGLASVAVWTYVFNEWWGGQWWGLLLAIAAAIPVGLIFSILPSILLGTLRRLPLVNDALLTWLFILGGIALAVYALIAFEGTTLAMLALSGAEIFVGGIGLFHTRSNAMRHQASMGEASEGHVRFLEETDRMRCFTPKASDDVRARRCRRNLLAPSGCKAR